MNGLQCGTCCSRCLPGQTELLLIGRAVSEVQVDKALVRNARFLGHPFEVGDRTLVEADRHRLLELRGIGVLPGVAEIVVFAHAVTYR